MDVLAHALQTLEHNKTITIGLEAFMSDVKLMTELRLYFDQLIMDPLNGHYVDQRYLRMPEYSEFLDSSYKEASVLPVFKLLVFYLVHQNLSENLTLRVIYLARDVEGLFSEVLCEPHSQSVKTS